MKRGGYYSEEKQLLEMILQRGTVIA